MRLGLYGKLPAKRDFVAVGASRAFLAAFEPWLQGGLSASRVALGNGWQEAFLRAPIWRFWLGAAFAGTTTLGAFAPSVDGVGRYFPLVVFAQAGEADALPPPEFERYAGWFPAAEDLLLSALEDGTGFEELTGRLARLADPAAGGVDGEAGALAPARGGLWIGDGTPDALPAALAALRRRDGERLGAGSTYWWTEGGEGFPPRFVAGPAMPDPYLFTFMLTGESDHARA